VKAYRVWPVITAVMTMCWLLGCHGSSRQQDFLGVPDRGATVVGVWELCAIGPSFDGPWYSAEETGSSGTWDIKEAGKRT